MNIVCSPLLLLLKWEKYNTSKTVVYVGNAIFVDCLNYLQ